MAVGAGPGIFEHLPRTSNYFSFRGRQEAREAKIDATGARGEFRPRKFRRPKLALPKESDVNRSDKKFHGRAISPSKISCDRAVCGREREKKREREREREIAAINSRTITRVAGQRHDQHRGCRLLLSFSFKDPGQLSSSVLVFCQKRRYSARYHCTADFSAVLHFSRA